MFKDKVKVAVVALVMVLLMVLSITSDAWEVREKQKSDNLTAQVSQAKTKCAADSTHAETTQNSMDVF